MRLILQNLITCHDQRRYGANRSQREHNSADGDDP